METKEYIVGVFHCVLLHACPLFREFSRKDWTNRSWVTVRRLSVIGKRIVCLFVHENKLKKKKNWFARKSDSRGQRGMLVASRKKRGASVINGAKTNQRLNLKEKHSELIISLILYSSSTISLSIEIHFYGIYILLYYLCLKIQIPLYNSNR